MPQAPDSAYKDCTGVNFVPGDGVSTSLVLGYGTNPTLFTDDNTDYDYIVCYETVNNTDIIRSRWFILEADRTREQQYNYTLRRDVIADNLDDVKNAPMYIEKGYIKDTKDPLLFNKEALQLNQIKQYEVPLMDETKTGWVVGYIPNNWSGATVEPKVIIPANADFTVAGISNWTYYYCCDMNPNWKPV